MSCPVCGDSLFKFQLVDAKVVILNQELFSCCNEHIQCKKCDKEYGRLCKTCLSDTTPLGYRVKEMVEWDEHDIKDKIQKTKSMNDRVIPFIRSDGDAQYSFIKVPPSKPAKEGETSFTRSKSNFDFSTSEDGVSEICFHTSKDDEQIAHIQQYYSDMCAKLRKIVRRFKRHQRLIPSSTLRIPKTLMPCPDDFCRHVGDIQYFNEHLHKCHKMLPKFNIRTDQSGDFVLDPMTIKHNIVRAFMLYKVTGIMEPSKTHLYQDILPVLLLGTRVNLGEIGDNNILLWLAGPVFHNFPLTVTLKVCRKDKIPIEKIVTCFLRSLYESPNPVHILQSGCALLLTEREGRKYTRHHKEFLNISVQVHW